MNPGPALRYSSPAKCLSSLALFPPARITGLLRKIRIWLTPYGRGANEWNGEIIPNAPFEHQVELILTQIKKALEAAGSDLDHMLKCNVMCVSADRFNAFNEVYKRFFPNNPPARIFSCVPEWTGPFDVEVDCIAVTKD
jgi:enamine deaminase RidA (YjgF/YER057c/UK114 family)